MVGLTAWPDSLLAEKILWPKMMYSFRHANSKVMLNHRPTTWLVDWFTRSTNCAEQCSGRAPAPCWLSGSVSQPSSWMSRRFATRSSMQVGWPKATDWVAEWNHWPSYGWPSNLLSQQAWDWELSVLCGLVNLVANHIIDQAFHSTIDLKRSLLGQGVSAIAYSVVEFLSANMGFGRAILSVSNSGLTV